MTNNIKILDIGVRRHPGLGAIPSDFNQAEALAWQDIVNCVPSRLLQPINRVAVEHAARQLAAFRNKDTSLAERRELNAWLYALGVSQPIRKSLGVSPAW